MATLPVVVLCFNFKCLNSFGKNELCINALGSDVCNLSIFRITFNKTLHAAFAALSDPIVGEITKEDGLASAFYTVKIIGGVNGIAEELIRNIILKGDFPRRVAVIMRDGQQLGNCIFGHNESSIFAYGATTIKSGVTLGAIQSEMHQSSIIGYWEDVGATLDISYCTALNQEDGDCNVTICTIKQLDSQKFYTETLGWSGEIWDFSDLDVENGKYPRLKQ